MDKLATHSAPFYALKRGSYAEVVVSGVALLTKSGVPEFQCGKDLELPVRSLLKPWQFLGQSRTLESTSELAMAVSSHFGQAIHQEQMRELLKQYDLSENDLGCPACMPLDQKVAWQLQESDQEAARIYHPCSGKHLQMIVCCDERGWERKGYLQPDHPLQKSIRDYVHGIVGAELTWLEDSCGAPMAVMTMEQHLVLWADLLNSEESVCKVLCGAMRAYPELVGGSGRLDTEIIRQSDGRILAKEGADGLLVCHDGEYGLMLKIASGYSSAHLGLALRSCFMSAAPLPKHWQNLVEWLASYGERWLPKDQNFSPLVNQSENI